MKKILFIAGAVTPSPEYPDKEYNLKRFDDKAIELMKDYAVFTASANHERLGVQSKFEWSDFMDQVLPFLLVCDVVYMLKGWETSDGAIVEHIYAKKFNKVIIYEE